MKSEVKELSQVLKIDTRIINAEPTDGLWDDDRTDEKQLGLSYDELEEAMTNSNSINREKYKKIRGNNTHKMNPIPVCKLPRR
jgi:NAD+ synthase